MTYSRAQQIDLSVAPFYHCINRCMRRAFLCSEDRATGKSYEHRREWIANKIKFLSELFAIDIAFYAVKNSHYHLVLRLDKELSEKWTHEVVIEKW